MHLTLERPEHINLIRGYSDSTVTVNEHQYQEGLVIMPQHLLHPWGPQVIHDLESYHLDQLLELGPEMILLGTGPKQQFPDPRLTYPLMAQGIGVEVMDTQAACRTYNIVVAEGRNVAAALLLA